MDIMVWKCQKIHKTKKFPVFSRIAGKIDFGDRFAAVCQHSQFSHHINPTSAMVVISPKFQTVTRGMWRERLIEPQTGAFFAQYFSGAHCIAHGSAMSERGP
ncbi:MAG: hypothetical protein KDJ90_02535 [Nitratireductor sp.]|nr:hypothetical protein [Nitratireductor sp.]